MTNSEMRGFRACGSPHCSGPRRRRFPHHGRGAWRWRPSERYLPMHERDKDPKQDSMSILATFPLFAWAVCHLHPTFCS